MKNDYRKECHAMLFPFPRPAPASWDDERMIAYAPVQHAAPGAENCLKSD